MLKRLEKGKFKIFWYVSSCVGFIILGVLKEAVLRVLFDPENGGTMACKSLGTTYRATQ
jgi:hypothetical protein